MNYSSSSSQSSGDSRQSSQLLSRVQEKVANIYYKHGLICSRHPYLVIIITLLIVFVCCYPITGIRYLLGNSSQKYITTIEEPLNSVNHNHNHNENSQIIDEIIGQNDPIPRWFETNSSYAYVQQIVIKSSVIPWNKELILMDAIRAPLSIIFKLMESISNYQYSNGEINLSLDNVCFQVSEPISKIDRQSASYLPTYSCLSLSPANIWQNDVNKFLLDSTIIKTMYSIKDLASPHSSGSLRDILFGVPWMETGIKRLYVRTRQRTITYAITLAFSKYNQQYIDGLTKFLRQRFPLNPYEDNHNNTDSSIRYSQKSKTLTHIYFQNKFTLSDFMPLGATYVMLFLYVYFSVRKIDLVKNKWALALCSVLTVIMSLLMSLGICIRCGFNPTLNGNYILPYLVVIIGLENMLVMTQSVVSTAAHLDIKVRVAQGLSREGWSITKNLMTEITLLTFGFFTFVPIVQEFCLFATVGLLSDFFLQITFFATVLSVDIQRLELNINTNNFNAKAQTHSRHNSSDTNGLLSFGSRTYPQNVFARPAKPSKQFKMPKRLRVVHFVARTRLVQRALMIVLIVWISLLVYKSGIVEHLSGDLRQSDKGFTFPSTISRQIFAKKTENHDFKNKPESQTKKEEVNTSEENEEKSSRGASVHRLVHHNPNLWKLLSSQHWSALFNYYNISLSGKFITILPPILLSIAVDPESAISTRNKLESDPQIFRQFLTPSGLHSSIDPNDEKDDYYNGFNGDSYPYHSLQWSSGEIFITIGLSVPSIIFMIYVFVLMYRCMCTRNYAEWRASWSQTLRLNKGQSHKKGSPTYEYFNFETNPIRLQNQGQELSHLASNSDTPFVMSTCMAGDIRVWDVLSGECHTHIRRSSFDVNELNATIRKTFQPKHKPSGSFSSDSTYGSSPGNTSTDFPLEYGNASSDVPTISPQIHWPNSNNQSNSDNKSNGYDFSMYYNNCSSQSSQNILTNLILNAAINSEAVPTGDLTENLKIDSALPYEPIWCCEIFGKLVIVGCGNGRIEVWDALSGNLCYYYDDNKSGVTQLRATNTKLIVARLNGTLEIFHLETINGFSVSVSSSSQSTPHPARDQVIRYNLIHSVRAHLQPITSLQTESSNIITGGLDHLLKVYRSDTANCLYTLHGHCGGITNIHIDQYCPSSAISGCQVGQLCVWDVLTGTCVFSLEAHQDASVSSLIATPLYFISSGTDNRICVWDKYSGHLVQTIQHHHSICREMLLLTPNILVTAKEDHLVLWDISEAIPLRIISLDTACDKQNYIKCLKLSSQSRAVVCDYGKQLCVIHFPSVTEKND